MHHTSKITPRQLRAARREFNLSRAAMANVLGVSTLGVLLRELGILPIEPTLAHLVDAFRQGFRPSNWPVTAAA